MARRSSSNSVSSLSSSALAENSPSEMEIYARGDYINKQKSYLLKYLLEVLCVMKNEEVVCLCNTHKEERSRIASSTGNNLQYLSKHLLQFSQVS